MLTGSSINVYFKIKFEEIPTKSILRFNLHIKDENYIQEKYDKLNSSDFKDYGSKLFISNLNKIIYFLQNINIKNYKLILKFIKK